MKTLYFDCGMGAAGDMLMASLYEICPDKEKFLKSMNEMGLPGLSIEAEPSVKCGITGTHMKVTIHGEEEESVDVDLQGHEHEHHQEHNHEDSQHSHAHDHHHDHEDTHHDHSHESHHHAHEMAESAAEQTVHECIYDKQADQNHENQNDLNHPHTHDHDHNCGHDHTHDHGHPHHHHASMAGISHIIEHLNLPEEVKNDIVAVYRLIAEAESHVHGKTVEEIHFHEVGTADAIADVRITGISRNSVTKCFKSAAPVGVQSSPLIVPL